MNFLRPILLAIPYCCGPLLCASDSAYADASLDQPVTEQHFQALLDRSPFTRSIGNSDALVLSGIANVGSFPVLMILDTENGQSISVSERPNEQGWKLETLSKPNDLESAIASISLQGGEVVRVRYDEERIKNAVKKKRIESSSGRMRIAVGNGTVTVPDWITRIKDPTERGQAIAKLIENGTFDKAPFQAVDLALSQSNPQTRGPVLSAAFGRLGGGVGGVEYKAAVNRLNSLKNGRDRDFAINGLAHGLVGRDPKAALKWANSISNEGFRKVVVENVTRRIEKR